MAKIPKALIMDEKAFDRTLTRLAHEINENDDLSQVVLAGILRRGVPIASRLCEKLRSIAGADIPIGKIDITCYRDDLTEKVSQPEVGGVDLPVGIEGKTIVLVDDVIFTGRTARAAIEAVLSVGRPKKIRLAVIIDRGHRELPIRPDYVGKNIPTSLHERIGVCLPEYDGEFSVKLFDI